MKSNLTLPTTISIFPLPGAMLLPRSHLPLHIFEPRYLAMIDDALKTDHRMIGMIQPYTSDEGETRLKQIGCAGRLTQFNETNDGRYMITLTGLSRFRVLEELDGFTPYRRCDVSWNGFQQDRGGPERDEAMNRERLYDLLNRFFEKNELQADWETLHDAADELLINSLSMLLDLDPEDKQALLEAPSLITRRETLVTLLEYALHESDGSGGDFLQ